MDWKIYLLFLFPVCSFFAQLSIVKVEPSDYTCQHRKQIRGDPESLFYFLINPHTLERLLPWLTRFKEADKRVISAGKSYLGVVEVPLLGERIVNAILTEYKPPKRLAFDFTHDYLGHKIMIHVRSYHDRTLLQTTIYFQRNSFLYQSTVGYLLRWYFKSHLENSMKIVAEMFERLDRLGSIPDFSKHNRFKRF